MGRGGRGEGNKFEGTQGIELIPVYSVR